MFSSIPSRHLIMNPDLLDEFMVKEKLKNGECITLVNSKDRTSTWSDLRLIADAKHPNKVLIGWAVCRFCSAAFRTHSKANEKGKRKNHGLTSCTKHLEQCLARKKELAETSQSQENASVDSNETNTQPWVSQFLVNTKKIGHVWLQKLKEAEAQFVVGGKTFKTMVNMNTPFSFRYAFV